MKFLRMYRIIRNPRPQCTRPRLRLLVLPSAWTLCDIIQRRRLGTRSFKSSLLVGWRACKSGWSLFVVFAGRWVLRGSFPLSRNDSRPSCKQCTGTSGRSGCCLRLEKLFLKSCGLRWWAIIARLPSNELSSCASWVRGLTRSSGSSWKN